MDDKEFLDLLVANNLIARDKADIALRDAKFGERDLELLLYENRLVDDVAVAELKGKTFQIPYKKVDVGAITEDVLKFAPPEVAQTYRFIPLERRGDTLIVGMLKPKDLRAQDALRFIGQQQKLNLGVYLISYSDFEALRRKYSPFKNEVDEALRSIERGDVKSEATTSSARMVEIDAVAAGDDSAPIIKLVSSIFKHAVGEGASDLHIEPQRNRVRIRFRIDGDLHEVLSLPLRLHQHIVSRIKILSDLKIDENRRPQDGRFRTTIFGKEIDFRVSTLPTSVGEKAVLRVLDPSQGLKSITELGLGTRNLATLQQSIGKPYGMILITGPTGSGKTTTLYSIFQYLNREDVNIISLEDPVEYTLEGINQSQMMPEIGYSFATGLRQVLRQDPDIIMIGEIRDPETAELSVHAALTGHLVLSTLHTNNATGVIPRLIDMHVEPFLLAPALNVMIAQRLVSRVCQDCEEAVPVPPNMQKIITDALADLPDETQKEIQFKTPYVTFAGKGCAACKHKGVRGRVAIHEILAMTPQLALIISEGAHGEKIFAEAKRQGMISLRQDGILKSLAGQITIEEVLRETGETTDA